LAEPESHGQPPPRGFGPLSLDLGPRATASRIDLYADRRWDDLNQRFRAAIPVFEEVTAEDVRRFIPSR
jgi:hypothetical protein